MIRDRDARVFHSLSRALQATAVHNTDASRLPGSLNHFGDVGCQAGQAEDLPHTLPRELNCRFTGGLVRVVYAGIDDLRALVPDLTTDDKAKQQSSGGEIAQ